MRVFFSNLGCKLNQAEIDALARRFAAAGHVLASKVTDAELHVINSCTVTHLAARDSRKIARRGKRMNADLRTIVTGCYASDQPEELAEIVGVDLVVPNNQKDRILELVQEAFPESKPERNPLPVPYVPIVFGRARALVKIEDGCNMSCAFCIIPTTRGRQQSRPLEDVIKEVNSLSAAAHREVVVTGVQISEYDDEGHRLYDLVKALLEQTDISRLRLTSIAPWKFDNRLLELWADRRLCRHIHMSLQSGSTSTLRRMRRPYTAEGYATLAERLREAIPGLALTTDVIVGFPGETASEFEESLRFVERLEFARPHLFSYSPRAGTRAETLPNHVSPAVKKARMARMLAVAEVSDQAFRQSQTGELAEIVWEEQRDGRWSGLSDNYIRVFAESRQDLSGTLSTVRLGKVIPGGMEAWLEKSSGKPLIANSSQGGLAEPRRQNTELQL